LVNNRIDPVLFGRCFENWIAALWPDQHDLIAIDGKTSRRTHDTRKGLKAPHTLSAYASNARLVLGQLSLPEKTNEITAIPSLLDHMAATNQLQGALATIDAIGCQIAIADKIIEHRADYLLALKGNQPTLETEVATGLQNHCRKRGMAASRREPIRPRPKLTGLYPTAAIRVSSASPPSKQSSRSICALSIPIDRLSTRGFASRRLLSTSKGWPMASAATGGSMHWLLDVEFKDDLPRYRSGHGAKNMAIARRFAPGLVRANKRREASKLEENPPAGTPTTFSNCYSSGER
jgi:predicted transposase YbfD/YdcC